MSENGANNIEVRYAMVIDQRRCTGCHACAIACKSENQMPVGKSLNVVLTEGSNTVDIPPANHTPLGQTCSLSDFNRTTGPRNDYLTRACQHCEDAPCVAVCPYEATTQREDGIVVMDPTKCKGDQCGLCMDACPYGYGTMRVLIKDSKFVPDFEFGDRQSVENIDNTVKKCTFCAHRIDRGEKPFCVDMCPSRARYFGNINDTGSDVYRLLQKWEGHTSTIPVEVGKTGTEPFVYFLKADRPKQP